MLLAGVALQLLITPAAVGAVCIVWEKPEDLFARAEMVLLGRVVAAVPTGAQGDHVIVQTATLRVEKMWKGSLVREVRIGSDRPFEVGRSYLVFAAGTPPSTSILCRWAEPEDRAAGKLEWLAKQGSAQVPVAVPSRQEIIAAATDIVRKARYCTLATIGEDGHPQARVVDPLGPDPDFTLWVATNPLTRKVRQIQRDPRTTVLCFDAATSSYVTVLGRAKLITDPVERKKHWKDDWAPIYPAGPGGAGVMLIQVTPLRLEIVSESRGIAGDPKTWLPFAIEFPGNRQK